MKTKDLAEDNYSKMYTPESAIDRMLSDLERVFEDILPQESFDEFVKSQRYEVPKSPWDVASLLIMPHVERVKKLSDGEKRSLEESAARVKNSVALALHYGFHAGNFNNAGERDKAWFYVAEANKWAGTASGEALAFKVKWIARQRPARLGGEGRAKKFEKLEKETIRLYLERTWESVPLAAQEITPKIVAMSKGGNGDLLPTTSKPLEWIRKYNRSRKKVA